MNKINVEILSQQPVDTELNTSNIIQNTNELFKSSELLKIKDNRRNKLYDQYNIYYNLCINKIKKANAIKKTDLIFTVPKYIFGNYEYNSIDCIDFIENKLHKSNFDTTKINEKTLFITWIYLELYV